MTLVHDSGSNMLSVQQQYQIPRGNVIVSANNNNNNNSKAPSTSQQKRKMYAQATPYSSTSNGQTASVARRNARERNRVKQVNNGFATLRQHIPQSVAQALGGNTAGTQGGARAGSKKLSKVETLRMAVEYIRNLKALLDDTDADTSSIISSSQLSPASSSMGSPSQSELGSPQMMDHEQHQSYHHQSPQQHQPQEQQPQLIKFEIKSESCSDDEQHYVQHHQMQPMQHHPHHHNHQFHPHHLQPQQLSPVYVHTALSDASVSPTPSFVSDASSTGGSQGYGSYSINTTYAPHPESYDNYQPMSPEDEILDYISFHLPGKQDFSLL